MATEMAAAGASSIATKAAESFYDIAQSRISYVFKYKRYVEELRKQVELLKRKKELIEQDVRHARRRGDGIYNSVEIWQGKVRGVIERVEKSINEEEEEKAQKKRCLSGLCPNLMTRYNLSKEAVKASKDVDDLLKEAVGFSNKVSYEPSPERGPFLNDIEGCQQFDSRRKVFWDVINELKESKSNRIGVYGMGGVGKTTLAKQVAKEVMEVKLFDEVVMAEVTQSPDLKKIQDKIAYDLGLVFDQNLSLFERAGKLRRRLQQVERERPTKEESESLKKEKKVLIILDNVWGKFNLEEVGIPTGIDNGRQTTILFTSRSLDVLCNEMNSKKNFSIDVLSPEESMGLFWKSVGDHSKETSDFESLAVEILRILGGLPLAIKTIANALKNKSPLVWTNALNQLRNSNAQQIHGMDAEVYSSIKWSYDFLQSEETKSLFRLCALQKDGSRISINDLMMYGMGLSLFKKVHTLKEGRTRVGALIDNLKSSCLLLDGDTEDDVKMHDIVHAVAISIATDELMLNIPNAAELKEEEENGIQEDATAISLPYTDIQRLPARLKCPKLKLFLLFANHGNSLQIPDLFFERMKELKVLHITEICLLSIPSSLGSLVNLHTLFLINCYSLKDIALLGELKKLEILSFRDSDIEELPVEIGQLTQLRLLDLDMCSRLALIAPNVISKLSRLEELFMGNSFTRWGKVEGQASNASLVELNELSNLKALDVRIPDIEVMPQNLFFVELERYKISIGDDVYFWDWSSRYETSRSLKLQGIDNNYLGYGIQLLMKTVEDLCLDTSSGFQSVFRGAEGFPLLKHLFIQNSPEISYIVHSVERINCNAFPLLESLFLYKLITLEKICQGQLREDQSFSKLRIIKVKECHRLKHLFSFSIAKNLLQLQEIQVIHCNDLKMIFGNESEIHLVHENEHCSRIDFTQLRSLSLKWLPQLTSSGFDLERSVEESTITAASQEIIAEDDLKTLFNNMVIFPCVEKLKLSNINIEKIWLDQLPAMSSCSQNLTKLTVEECHNLKYLFSPSMVNSLVELQELAISRCKSIEGVIDIRLLGTEEEAIEMVFPKLILLRLACLPNLTTFGIGNSINFPSLRQLDIEDCQNLERFISTSTLAEGMSFKENIHSDIQLAFFDEKVAFPRLEKLQLYELSNLIHIWKENSHTCNVFQSLRTLKIDDCEMLENIIELQVGEEVKDDRIVFNQLEYLKLKGLPRLRSFCLGNYKTLEFPYLKEVGIHECPNMQIFSDGVLHTPKLHEVKYKDEEEGGCWEDNLNSTIQKMFEEMVGFDGIDSLKLSEFPQAKDKWHSQELPANDFRNLRSLVVDNCTFMLSAIPVNLLRFLNNLETLEVRNCDSVEEVFHLEEVNADGHFGRLFPKLERLVLLDLPKLKRFCNFTKDIIELPNLFHLLIENCPNMEKFISDSTQVDIIANKEPKEMTSESKEINILADIQPLFDEKVVSLYLKELKLSKLPKLLHLCKENSHPNNVFQNLEILEVSECHKLEKLVPSATSFNSLKTLKVSKCDGLINLVTLITAKSLGDLEEMKITDCKMIEEIIELQVEEEVKEDPIVFSQLEYLELDGLPSLKCFYLGNYTLEFPNLEKVIVKKCLKMKIFSLRALRTPKLQRLHLVELEDEGRWEGDLNTTIQKLFKEMNVQDIKEEDMSIERIRNIQ